MTTLEEKIDLTRSRIRELASHSDEDRVAVAWTGGKDSTLVLWFWRELIRQRFPGGEVPVRALNLDTGLKFSEVLAFRDELREAWGLELTVVCPEVDLGSYPVARDPLACCRDLKIEPLKRAVRDMGVDVLLTGLRQDEHPSRQGRPWLEERTDPDYTMAHPIHHWTEMDIWSMYMAEDLPYCSLYEQGYRSLGCRPCTSRASQQERSGREARKEDMLDVLRSLGYF